MNSTDSSRIQPTIGKKSAWRVSRRPVGASQRIAEGRRKECGRVGEKDEHKKEKKENQSTAFDSTVSHKWSRSYARCLKAGCVVVMLMHRGGHMYTLLGSGLLGPGYPVVVGVEECG